MALPRYSPRRIDPRAKRARYWRRRLLVLLLLIGVLLLSWGAVRLVAANLKKLEPDLGFRVERRLPISEGLELAVGAPAQSGYRVVALVEGSGAEAKKVGAELSLKAELPLSIRTDLGAIPVLWVEQHQKVEGAPVTVEIPGGQAERVRGGEPIPLAWIVMPHGLLEVTEPLSLLAPLPAPFPTGIVVDLDWNVLWFFEEGQLQMTARVSTGQFRKGPEITPANWQKNLRTPRGEFKVGLLQEGMTLQGEELPAGHPLNPYGSRWIGFSVLPGDGASIWAIHGTNKPESIGRWGTNGTIAMRNQEIEGLYQKMELEMPILIQGGQ